MAESPVFRKEWVLQIKEMLDTDDDNSLPKACGSLRVAKFLLDEKPEAYIPHYLSFGPLHHWKLEKIFIDSSSMTGRISKAEAYKGNCAAKLAKKLRNCGKSFYNLVEMIEQTLPEIACFYGWPISTNTEDQYSKNFALMMAVDSSFLLRFLFTLLGFHDVSHSTGASSDSSPSLDADVVRLCTTLLLSVMCDIMKLENQIPLYVLRGVFQKVKETLIIDKGHQENLITDQGHQETLIIDKGHKYFNLLLQKMCKKFSPFRVPEIGESEHKQMNEIDDEPHLLGCMHSFVSPFLEMHAGGEYRKPNRTLWGILKELYENLIMRLCRRFLTPNPNIEHQILKGISAGQLERGGIELKSFSSVADKIRVEKCTDTLYLPAIAVSDSSSEVFLRNMVAMEFNDALRPKSVTRYVTLMGCLIQSADDVSLLKDRGIIYREYSPFTDESIFRMWNSLSQPSFTGAVINVSDVKLIAALEEVLAKNYRKLYYKNEIKRMIWGFKTIWGLIDYFSSWKFIAPLCALLVMAMTAIQTYYTYAAWLVSSSQNSKQ